MDYKTYKVDLKHLISRKKITINLSETRTEAEEQLKTTFKKFSIWWRKSKIYC